MHQCPTCISKEFCVHWFDTIHNRPFAQWSGPYQLNRVIAVWWSEPNDQLACGLEHMVHLVQCRDKKYLSLMLTLDLLLFPSLSSFFSLSTFFPSFLMQYLSNASIVFLDERHLKPLLLRKIKLERVECVIQTFIHSSWSKIFQTISSIVLDTKLYIATFIITQRPVSLTEWGYGAKIHVVQSLNLDSDTISYKC